MMNSINQLPPHQAKKGLKAIKHLQSMRQKWQADVTSPKANQHPCLAQEYITHIATLEALELVDLEECGRCGFCDVAGSCGRCAPHNLSLFLPVLEQLSQPALTA